MDVIGHAQVHHEVQHTNGAGNPEWVQQYTEMVVANFAAVQDKPAGAIARVHVGIEDKKPTQEQYSNRTYIVHVDVPVIADPDMMRVAAEWCGAVCWEEMRKLKQRYPRDMY